MAEYPINKGIGRSVEFKGLKAQYLFIFAGGLLATFILFVVMYMAGVPQWFCIGTELILASLVVYVQAEREIRRAWADEARSGEVPPPPFAQPTEDCPDD